MNGSQEAHEFMASARECALLVLTVLRDDTRRELTNLEGSPNLLKHSPKHAARLRTLLDALSVAIEDMHAAAAANSAPADSGDG